MFLFKKMKIVQIFPHHEFWKGASVMNLMLFNDFELKSIFSQEFEGVEQDTNL